MGQARPAHGRRQLTRPLQHGEADQPAPAAASDSRLRIDHAAGLSLPTQYRVEWSVHGLHANWSTE